ncbi:MAG TPA: amidohydrolase family protein [Bacillales bacterium]|nr:amidohydrolase family protein [Bacillales bacterium]
MKIIDNIYLYRPQKKQEKQLYHLKIEDGKIQSIHKGRTEEEGSHVYDGKGRTLTASFTDSHLHFLRYGLMKQELDLRKATTWADFKKAVVNHYKDIEHHGWIAGNGMVDDSFTDLDHLVTADDLEELDFDKPMFFLHEDAHQCVVNHKALRILKEKDQLGQYHDQFIEKDENGEWTGRFKDTAVHYIKFHFRQRGAEDVKKAVGEAVHHLTRHGITSIHTDDLNFTGSYDRVWEGYRALEKEGKLPVKVHLHHYVFHKWAIQEFLDSTTMRTGDGSERVKVGAIKIFLDGTQRLHTAAMKNPYHDRPDTSGNPVYTQEQLNEMVRLADENNMQVTMHAIGDLAVEQAVNAIEQVGAARMRHRIIHIQTLSPELVQRLKEVKPYAEIQPSFLMGEYDKKEKWSGKEQAPYCDAWGTVWREGIPFTGSSDSPISPLNPLVGIFAAVNRTDEKGNPEGGWMPDERLPLDVIYRAYTETPPYLEFQENVKGKIEEGYMADFILLSEYPKEVEPHGLKDIKVLETWVDGEKVFDFRQDPMENN